MKTLYKYLRVILILTLAFSMSSENLPTDEPASLTNAPPENTKNTHKSQKFSSRFVMFMPFIFHWEGEYYENDIGDPGGETAYGIDARSHPDVVIRTLTKSQATEIYWKEWLQAGCDDMPAKFGEVFFNCAVNMGLGRAKQFAARSRNCKEFLHHQESYYRKLGKNPKRAKYLKGWLNRTNALRAYFGIEA